MAFLLIADTEPARGVLPFLQENWLVLLPPVLGYIAIYALLPRVRRVKRLFGGVLTAAALILGAIVLIRANAVSVESLLFLAFSGLAIAAGVMMITQKNPVHAALSLALVVLSTCGLFLLLAAPFLMAATIIIYAGAIVVTFLFVIMLAQQEGPSNADGRSREPFLASLAGCVLLGSLLCILHRTYDTRELEKIVRDLQQLSEAADIGDVKRILGDPAMEPESVLLQKLKASPEANVVAVANDLDRHWKNLRIEPIKKYAKVAFGLVEKSPQEQGSLARLQKTPGKEGTPGHFPAGQLPAGNVAAIGKTLFTDYLIGVEFAAVLLLVATIGAIAIAGRKTEELR